MKLSWYQGALSQITPRIGDPAALLNAAELERYHAMAAPQRQQQLLASRWLLHHVLQQEFAVPFGSRYELQQHRRLQLSTTQQFQISISHSHQRVAIAVTDGPAPIGIDVEYGKPRTFTELAEGCLSYHEQQQLNQLPDKQQQAAFFYRCWTLKEALFKQSQQPMSRLFQSDVLAQLQQQPSGNCLNYRCSSQENYFHALVFEPRPDLTPPPQPRSVVE